MLLESYKMLKPKLSRTILGLWSGVTCCLLLSALVAQGIIGVDYQMQLGNPSNATSDTNNHSHFLIQRTVEALDYNDSLGLPNWASWNLSIGDLGGATRSDNFFADTNLPSGFYVVQQGDYSGSGFDRGHLCPSADRTDNDTDNDMVFYMSNIMPQAADNNQGVWESFENYCRTLTLDGSEVLIICGPGGFDGSRFGNGTVAIPSFTWKITVVVPPGEGSAASRISTATRVIALHVPNTNGISRTIPWTNFLTSAGQLQSDTGLTFFSALAPEIAAALRAKVDGQGLPAPYISGFAPWIGLAGTNVVITGTNFDSATAVAFNGVAASFTVDSSAQITAVVPAGATTGRISVTTAGGTAASGRYFMVGVPTPDLAIRLSHTTTFTQGDADRTYTITVTNLGTGNTTGLVSVVDVLPTGLTATSASGTGWTIDLPTLTFTRSDSLALSNSYPALTLHVAVATNAAASLTNLVTVSGGGETNLANNSASDATAVAPGFIPTNGITLAGWDASTMPGGANNFGPTLLAPITNAPHLTVNGWLRGPGVATNATGAWRGWGGVNFTNASAALAVASNRYFSCSLSVDSGYTVSYTAVNKFTYRRSSTGPPTGVLQYQLGAEPFQDAASLAFTASTSAGGTLGPIDLSGITALQKVGAGTNVTFRIVNYGASGPTGTWYIFDLLTNTTTDIEIQGTIEPVQAPLTPSESWRLLWFGTTSNSGPAADTAVSSSDGMPNLLKYALGLDPTTPATNPVTGDITTGYLRLTTPRNPDATDVLFLVEAASDFSSWSTNGTTIDLDTPTLLQVSDGMPVSANTNRFMRLHVARP